MPRFLTYGLGAWLVLLGLMSYTVGPVLPMVGIIATLGAVALSRVDVAWTFSLAVVAYMFTGHAGDIGFPIDPARVLLALGFGRLLLERLKGTAPVVGQRITPAQAFVLIVSFAYVIASALISGTLTERKSIFFLVDQYGVVPFLLFSLGPRIFGQPHQRRALLTVLCAASAYLALTGLLEGLGFGALTFPSYIHDPAVGIHYGRARGPFVFAVAMGAAVTIGALISLLLLQTSSNRRARIFAVVLAAASASVVLMTLTRGAWIAGIAAVLVGLLILPRFRLAVPAIGIVTAALIVGLLAAFPALSDSVTARADNERPVWERQNTYAAAVRLVEDHSVFGVGWSRYTDFGDEYLRQPRDIPIAGQQIPVHNVPLLVSSELGLLGFAVWLSTFTTCILVPLMRRGPPERDGWRALSAGTLVVWAITCLFAPQAGPYTTAVLWSVAAVVAHSRFEQSTDRSTARPSVSA